MEYILLEEGVKPLGNIPYDELVMFLDWQKTKSELKFNPQVKTFPIIPNCIYWAFMGCNIGSEEGKHRPVLVTWTYKNSPICTVLPLTTQRLNDEFWYHIDMEYHDSTVLCEQMRVIDVKRIEKPYRISGRIVSISKKDWDEIDKEIKWLYKLQNKPEE